MHDTGRLASGVAKRLLTRARAAASDSVVLATAKWLVPSAAGLFAVIGYVVQTGHTGLVGRNVQFASGPGYAGAAADFLRDLPTITFDAVLNSGGQLVLAGHGLEIALALLLVAVSFAAHHRWRDDPRLGRYAAVVPGLALFLLLAWKFVYLDAPLTKVEGLVIPSGAGELRIGQASRWRSEPMPGAKSRWMQREIADRANCLYASLAVSRLRTSGAIKSQAPGLAELQCPALQDAEVDFAEAEFVARLLACALVAVLAAMVVRQRSAWAGAVSSVGLASLLTLPYAYGKLIVPTYFEVGRVVLAEPLTKAAAMDARLKEDGAMDAIVLSRRGSEVDLLAFITGVCSRRPGVASPVQTYQVARLWTISASQILSIREIHREDVIAWKLRNELECPNEVRSPGMDLLQRKDFDAVVGR